VPPKASTGITGVPYIGQRLTNEAIANQRRLAAAVAPSGRAYDYRVTLSPPATMNWINGLSRRG
jgi:hypothetical protein